MNSQISRLALVFVSLLLLLHFVGASVRWPVVQAAPAAPVDTPIPVVNEALFSDYIVSDGLLYWLRTCAGFSDEFRNPGFLRRMPTNSTVVTTIEITANANCATFKGLGVTPDGVYYLNQDANPARIEFRSSGAPQTVQPIYATDSVYSARIVLADNYLYWLRMDKIVRVRKDGQEFGEVAIGLNRPTGLVVKNGMVYWVDNSGFWSTNVVCGALPCNKNPIATMANKRDLVYYDYGAGSLVFYWISLTAPQKIMRYSCNGDVCVVQPIYTAPDAGTVSWFLGQPASNGAFLFWQEVSYDSATFSYDVRLRRMALDTLVPLTIAEHLGGGASGPLPVHTDAQYVYFVTRNPGDAGIRKLATGASVIARDLTVDALEVTQGIQNLANDVPLVAEKPTFVRAYGSLASGQNTFNVDAYLYGSRNGTPLPGSPLRPLNTKPDLLLGIKSDREFTTGNWLFRLPAEWLTDAIDLRIVLDPRQFQSDPNLANNERTMSLNFSKKAPICVVLVPVKTHYENLFYNDPMLEPALDQGERLLPAAIWRFWSFNPVEEWPGGRYAPFEFGEDNLAALTAINTRAVFSSNPKICNQADARTHFVGVVPNAANPPDNASGMGHFSLDSSWFAIPTPNNSWINTPFWPSLGATFPHELGHNYSRLHVDCGDPSFTDLFYPYNEEYFADFDPSGYFGFDSRTLRPVAPNSSIIFKRKVGDLMSYCAPVWTSDYTWRKIMNGLDDTAVTNASTGGYDLAAAAEAVYITGIITGATTTTPSGGALNHAWVFPTAALNGGLLQKWQRYTARAIQAAAHDDGHSHAATGDYHLHLLHSTGAILTDSPVMPVTDTLHTKQTNAMLFVTTLAAPAAPVAKVQLLEGDTVLATLTPGVNQPTVTILKPAGGETFTAGMEVTWQASDADGSDALLYTLQYSPDNGQSWYALHTAFPGPQNSNTVTINLDAFSLTGSLPNEGLMRVAASDGYHTTLATSQPFTVTNRAPLVAISLPTLGETTPAGQSALLRGNADDPEEGGLSGAALQWRVGNGIVGAGEEALAVGFAPGDHVVTLTAQDSLAQTATATATLTILPLGVPQADEPLLDGFCDDAAYANAAQLGLKPYTNGDQTSVQLVRSADYLWACFSGMTSDSGTIDDYAGLYVDANHSRDNQSQADDYGFFVDESGGVFTTAGAMTSRFAAAAGPGGLAAQVSAQMTTTWNAELRIDATILGGWGRLVGLAAGHYAVGAANSDHTWPYAAGATQPASWALTALGEQPQITTINPFTTTVGSVAFSLVITGQNFVDGATILWNGTPLTTTFVNSTTVNTTIGASQLSSAGEVAIYVRNPGNLASNPARFTVLSPYPTITSLTPATAQAQSSGFTLTVNGNNFVQGAQINWEGEALPTTFVSSTEIHAQVAASHLADTAVLGITVINPAPTVGMGNVAAFTVTALPTTSINTLFIPLIYK